MECRHGKLLLKGQVRAKGFEGKFNERVEATNIKHCEMVVKETVVFY